MYIAIMVRSSDNGMAMEMMNVEVSDRRNSKITPKASTEPMAASCQRLLIDCLMYVDWSNVICTLTPGGTPRSFGMRARTWSTTSTVLPPGCLFTLRYTARSPLTRTTDCWVSASPPRGRGPDPDRGAARGAPHHDVLHGLHHGELVVGEDVVVELAELHVPRGRRKFASLKARATSVTEIPLA
jgi:hypothetical protein